MVICPHDCELCQDPVCLVEGCSQTGTYPMDACEGCGDVMVVMLKISHCHHCRDHDTEN